MQKDILKHMLQEHFRKLASSVWNMCQTCAVHSPGEKTKEMETEMRFYMSSDQWWPDEICSVYILKFTVYITMMLFDWALRI